MGKTKLKMTATLTIVTEVDTELYKSGANPNWQNDAIKMYEEWVEDELNETLDGIVQTGHLDNFKFEVITEDEGN